MGTAQELMAAWLRSRIHPVLREAGYSGSGQNFHRRFGTNWGIVNIQRSQWDWAERATFAINLGTASAIVLESRGRDPDRAPSETWCQWRERLGVLMTGRDEWWEIRQESNDAYLDQLGTEVGAALRDIAFPALAAHAPDEEILAETLGRRGGGHQMIDEAGVLLHALGGTEDQKQRFSRMVAGAQLMRRENEMPDLRPAQGLKRAQANIALLSDRRPERRAEAEYQLGRAKPTPELVEHLRARLDDTDERVRISAARALADLDDAASLDRMLDLLRTASDRFRAVELGDSLGRLARHQPRLVARIRSALQERQFRAIGYDIAGFGAILDRLPTEI